MKRRDLYRVAPIALALLVATTCSHHTSAQEKSKGKAVQKIRAAMAETLKRGSPGVMVAIVRNGEVLLAEASGNAGNKFPATNETLFPMGGTSRVLANLVLARLAESERLDPGTKINDLLTPIVLRDENATAQVVSLIETLRGRAYLPEYENFVKRSDLRKWPLRRALVENSAGTDRLHSGDLAYGILQLALERRLEKSWSAIVLREVAAPLGMKNLIPDARTGLPSTIATLHKEGMFGLTMEEKRHHTNFAAAHGAWIDAGDASRLLLGLLAACGGAKTKADLETLTEESIEFANFSAFAWHAKAPYLRIEFRSPGMHGGINLFPAQNTAWMVIANSSKPQAVGIPHKMRVALRDTLLPPPPPTNGPWNTAIGLGGGAGGRFNGKFADNLQGEWVADVLLHGKRVPLRMWINERRVTKVQFGEHRSVFVSSFNWGTRVTVSGGDLLRLRSDTTLKTEMELHLTEEDNTPLYRGELVADGDYCHMEFRLEFRRVEKE